ncbi:MAG: HTH domain-containing protein [Cyclobacteriaceae bacterium]
MAGMKYYKRIQFILELIEKERTGSPAQLARKLDLSERMVYNILESLRIMDSRPIVYCRERESYVFEEKELVH